MPADCQPARLGDLRRGGASAAVSLRRSPAALPSPRGAGSARFPPPPGRSSSAAPRAARCRPPPPRRRPTPGRRSRCAAARQSGEPSIVRCPAGERSTGSRRQSRPGAPSGSTRKPSPRARPGGRQRFPERPGRGSSRIGVNLFPVSRSMTLTGPSGVEAGRLAPRRSRSIGQSPGSAASAARWRA